MGHTVICGLGELGRAISQRLLLGDANDREQCFESKACRRLCEPVEPRMQGLRAQPESDGRRWGPRSSG